MSSADSFLHITHRTVAWFRKEAESDSLVIAAPFQRNAVWTLKQKAYFIDTILNGLPIPELYMQEVGYADGTEHHIVIDGQQRIRAALGFVNGEYALDGDDVAEAWRGKRFEDLTEAQKRDVFAYKFVVRILPPAPEAEVRAIFSRLNRNTVALNEQEIRNSTYWGEFIQCVQTLADQDPFWAESGIFTADDHRRMRDHEYISELMAGWLGGAQNKKDGLDRMYAEYERKFPQRKKAEKLFRATTAQIAAMIPDLRATRWRKKSDFYTLFLALLRRAETFPLSKTDSAELGARIVGFAEAVDDALKLADAEGRAVDPRVADYARAVVRATSDKSSRVIRWIALEGYVFNAWAAAQAAE